jgi:hypothetical protein
MRLTWPQIVMLNHASAVNYKRMEERRKSSADKEKQNEEDPIVMNGKRVSELNTDEMMAYLNA